MNEAMNEADTRAELIEKQLDVQASQALEEIKKLL